MLNEQCEKCPAYEICFHTNGGIKIDDKDCIGLYYYKKGYEAAENKIKEIKEKNVEDRDKEIQRWIVLKAWANDSDVIKTLTHIGYNRSLNDTLKILEELFYEARNMYDDIDELLFYIKYRLPDIFKRKQKSL